MFLVRVSIFSFCSAYFLASFLRISSSRWRLCGDYEYSGYLYELGLRPLPESAPFAERDIMSKSSLISYFLDSERLGSGRGVGS